MNRVILLSISGKLTYLVVTTGDLLLLVYESFCILYSIAFGNHFCGSFGKSNNEAICMSLFYMYF